MAVVDVLARIKADSSGFNKGINDAQKTLDRFSTRAVTKGTIIGNVLYQAASKAAVGFGRLLKGAFQESIQAAQETQIAQDRLRRLLLNTNGATEEQIAILHAHAKALEMMTVVSEGNIAVVQSQLATFDLHGSTIAKLTPAILDYVVAERGATASADTFRSYTNGLAQALNGQFGSLSRVGFVLSDYDKKMIKTGTETERAEAIVRILNTTYKDFASVNGSAASAQIQLSKAINKLKGDFGEALLPTIKEVQGSLNERLVPALQNLQARFANPEAIAKFISFIKDLLGNLKDFGQAIISVVEPVFTSVLLPAIKGIIAGFIGFIKLLGAVGRFIQKNITVFQVLAGVLVAVTAGVLAYRAQVLLVNGVSKIWATVTKNVTKAIKMLNVAMRMNPIGFVIGLIAALTAGFVLLWNKSENFRRIVISVGQTFLNAVAKMVRAIGPFAEMVLKGLTAPIRTFLGILAKIPGVGKYFQAAKDFADKAVDSVAEFADSAASKIEAFSAGLDKYSAKKVKAPKFEELKLPTMPDLSLLGTAGGDPRVDEKEQKRLAKLAEQLRKAKQDLKEKLADYNDFIRNDFAQGFTKGADTARDTILRGLDRLKSVFDAQAKVLGEESADKLEKAFDKVNEKVRAFIPQAMEVAQQLEDVEEKLNEARKRLEKANEERADAISRFGDLLRTPFGEPSQIQRALSDGSATVDSIISMYDELSATIEKRFTDIGGTRKDELLNFLTKQTEELIKLSRKREVAIGVLSELEDDLQQLITEQADFAKKLKSSLKDFATGLADLSVADEKASIKVIKTASGLVITQVKKTTSGIDRITNQLKERLAQTVAFSSNIQKLLASGLDVNYIRQLVEAGPEAAGETVKVLAEASAAQIAELNRLYTTINTEATKFGEDMSKVFYQNSIDMTTALRDGAQAELDSINTSMVEIRTSIEKALEPLRSLGTDLGEDLAQGLYDALLKEKDRLVALAQSIAAAIAAAMASALASIGVSGAAKLPKVVVPDTSVVPIPKVDTTPDAVTLPFTATNALKEQIKTLENLRKQTSSGEQLNFKLKEQIDELNDKLKTPNATSAVDERTRLQAMGIIPNKTGLKLGAGDFRMRENAGITANVVINTEKVSSTVTATTVSDAISRSILARRTG